MANPAEQRQLVGLEPLPGAAAVAEATTGHLGLDPSTVIARPGRQPLHDDDQRPAVGLAAVR